MRAALVRDFGQPLRVETRADPVLRPGGVIVGLRAAFVPSPMLEFTRGQVPYRLPPLPYVPGADAVGVIEAVADDVHGLGVGDAVYCDDWVTLRGQPHVGAYVGLGAMMPGGDAVLREWPDGCFAERFALPAECVTPLGAAAGLDPARLCRLGYLGTALNALRRGNFTPGQVAIVNGATGVLGVGTVVLLLALGAARVVAVGRKREVLARLERLDPARVRGVAVPANGIDAGDLVAAAGEPGQLFVDAIGLTRERALTCAGIGALGSDGYAVLMGGVDAEIPIAYATQMIGLKLTIRGSEWFPYAVTRELLRLVAAGVVALDRFEVRAFALAEIAEALAHAGAGPGAFEHVALVP